MISFSKGDKGCDKEAYSRNYKYILQILLSFRIEDVSNKYRNDCFKQMNQNMHRPAFRFFYNGIDEIKKYNQTK